MENDLFQSCHWKNVLILISLKRGLFSCCIYAQVLKILKTKDLILTIGIGVLLIMIAPIDVADGFFVDFIALALLVLLVTIYIKNPVDLSIFPMLLLERHCFDCRSTLPPLISFCCQTEAIFRQERSLRPSVDWWLAIVP